MTPTRILLCVWLAFHLLTMVVSITKDTPFGKAVRPYTDPYQWRVGVHQNWTMYAPNPRTSTDWVEYTGIYAGDTEVPLPLDVGRPDPTAVIWSYVRAGKLERNSVSRKHIRASYVRWFCRTSKEAGKPLRKITATEVRVVTPPPEQRGDLPRSAWPERRKVLESWNCKR